MEPEGDGPRNHLLVVRGRASGHAVLRRTGKRRRRLDDRPLTVMSDEWFTDGGAFASAESLAAALTEMAATRAGARAEDVASAFHPAPWSGFAPIGPAGDMPRPEDPVPDGDRMAELQSILGPGDARAVYQPIVDLSAGRVRGVDALTRFASGTPAQWFARAAKAGLSAELEASTASAALRGLSRLPGHVYLSLRFSAPTLLRPATGSLLAAAPLSRVAVEIGREHLDGEWEALAAALAPLRERGLRVALGTAAAGTMSLEQLVRIAPDRIKIGASLLRGGGAGRGGGALPHALAAFARDVGAEIVGEAIETADDLGALRELGAGCGQGHLIARPAGPPIDEERIHRALVLSSPRPIRAGGLGPLWDLL